jgi:hypothetical protein
MEQSEFEERKTRVLANLPDWQKRILDKPTYAKAGPNLRALLAKDRGDVPEKSAPRRTVGSLADEYLGFKRAAQ